MQKRRKGKTNKKPKKRKPILSKEYNDNESEVSSYLKSSTLIAKKSDRSHDVTVDDEINFFSTSLPSIVTKSETASTSNDDNEIESPADSHSRVGHSLTPQPASSYIQIEEINNLIQKSPKIKIISCDEEFFYTPTAEEIANINGQLDNQNDTVQHQQQQQPSDGIYFESMKVFTKKDSNMTRMVNRYNEEKNYNVIASSCLLKNQMNFTNISRKFLYKTDETGMRTFRPFFVLKSLTDIQENLTMISKKLLTITIREIKFIEHPLQTEEHRLLIKLENFYNGYIEKIQQNLIEKIKHELMSIREINKNLMKNASKENLDKLEDYMQQIKTLRRKLHKEELELKNLIQNSLDTWIQLKNCRKQQGYNFTTFKLLIQIIEIDSIADDEQEWNERLQLELIEVYREEFERYYKEKRLRKLDHSQRIRKPDTEVIRIDCEEILKNCTRCPGEPIIKLGHTNMDDCCKNLENFRDYYVQILFDNEFVGVTKITRLGPDFKVQINQSFGIFLEKKIPKNIRFKIFEKSKFLPGQKIANIFYSLNNCVDYTVGLTEHIEFSSDKFQLSGKLSQTIYCETELFETNDEFQRKNRTQISKEILKNWYDKHLINPLDPDVHQILNQSDDDKLKPIKDTRESLKKFDFNENTLLAFCSKDEIENNQRFRILKARHNKEMKYKDLKMIPVFENELVTVDDGNDSNEILLNEEDWMDPIDLHKYKGKKYLKKLYETIVNHCVQLNKTEDISNLLIGDEIPTLRTILNSIMGFLGPSRPLNPQKQSFLHALPMGKSSQDNFNVVINVVRATGIPVRNFFPNLARRNSSASTSLGTGQNLRYGNVRPYVCVSYGDKIARTMTADGSNPTFNEQLILPIMNNINELKDELKIQLFDEYIEDLITEDTARSMEVYQRIHVNWLGEYRMPINTIFTRQRIDGVFELNIPKILLGYTKPSLDPTDGKIPIDNLPEFRESVYLWLYISVEPQFDVTRMKFSALECSELREVKQHIDERSILIKELEPKRFLEPIISLGNGKKVCITRLLEAIPLPFQNVPNENLENLIRRYVSLFPIVQTSSYSCLGLEGVWLSNSTILDTTWASAKDLGVLLACFYMHLGIRCWLVLGISYPHGEVSYVLLQQEINYVVINPCTGKKYFTKDVNCPLLTAQYIVGQENIYCNLQRETRVSLTDFNFRDNSLWMPMFGRNDPAPIGGVHKLNYNYIVPYDITDLKRSIERKITKKINSWRSTRKTIWNRAFNNILYAILLDLEVDAVNDRLATEQYLDKITKEFSNYKFFGFTLNFTYTNLSSISERIKSTGIHLNTDRNVEFALAVHLHQYPNNILSCWIFMLTAIPFI